jgi:hypothetical protein
VDSRLVGVWADATVIAHQFDPARGSDPIAKEAIVRLPVDTSAMTLVAMAAPEQVVDFTTRQPKADPNGQPLYTVQVAAMYGDQGEVLAVKVAGEPAGIRPGGAVEVAGLVAQPWELGDRFGVSYRAAAIRPAEVAKGGERIARMPSAASTS